MTDDNRDSPGATTDPLAGIDLDPASPARRRRRRRRLTIVTAAVAVVALVAAASLILPGRGTGGEASAQTAPVSGGTLQFGLVDYQQTPDVQAGSNYAESVIGGNVVDKLTWQDPETGKITPWLATSWSHNDALTEFTFHLRHDVTFSDGSPFNAEVVKANLDQYYFGDKALEIKPNGATLLPGYLATSVDDEYTATVTFDRPSASFLQASSFTANNQPGIMALSTLRTSAAGRTDPKKVIGTGPFVYESWEAQRSTVLVKRPDYHWAPPALHHDGPAYLDRIVFNTVPEASVRTGSLVAGDLDATLDVQTTDEELLRRQGFEISAGRVPGADIRFDFNVGLAPTNDLAVRKAIQLGWNRDSVRKTVLTDSYETSTSVLARDVEGWRDYSGTVLRYDPDEARRLLDEAGWKPGPDGVRVKDGTPLRVKLNGSNNLVANRPAYESIQQDLADIGIDLQLTVVPIPDSTANKAKAKTDWNIQAFNRSRNDTSVLNTAYNPGADNSSYIDDSFPGSQELTTALQQLEETLDPGRRAELAAHAQDLILDKYALTNPVYTPAQVIGHAPYVHGLLFDAQARNPFLTTWLDSNHH
jgi:peptide/nickel transport system substrate-binding protein